MHISILSAKFNIADSVRFLKKGNLSKIFLLDSLRKEVFMALGRLETKAESSSILNFFLMFEHSSM